MKSLFVAFTVLAFTIIGFQSKAQTGTPVPELANFDAAMLNLLDDYNVPGGQLAITYQGRLVYNRGFGYADTTTQTLVQPNHIFRLASVSKPVTSIAILKLVENGLVELNDTVFGASGILNDVVYQDILDPRVYDITVEQLLRHEGGWDRDVSGDPMFNAYNIATAMGVTSPPDASTIIQYVISEMMLDFTPGTDYKYSNFSYAVLGRIVEKISGQTYENYVRNELLIPLGITDMGIGHNLETEQLPNEVSYYDYDGAPLAFSIYDNVSAVPWPYGGFNIEAMDANGGWVGSAEDLCKLLVAVDGFSTKPDMLSSNTLDAMTEPSTFTNYALGWAVNTNNNWWHNGSLPGTTTEIVRNGNAELNWAILLNTRPLDANALSNAVDQLVWNVLPTITSWPTNDFFTNIKMISDDKDFAVFPTLSNGTFYVRCDEPLNSIVVYDATGREVYVNVEPENVMRQMKLDNMPIGFYVVKGIGNTKSYVAKLVIE